MVTRYDSPLAATEALVRQYPAATLVDVYKSFFQDQFGPGHLIADASAARAFFDQELAGLTSQGRHHLEPCGLGQHYCRANLDLVADGLITADALFAAFMQGAQNPPPIPAAWPALWAALLQTLAPLQALLPTFAQDAAFLQTRLTQGDPVVSHSRPYAAAYAPHYRLIPLVSATILLPGMLTTLSTQC